VEKSQVTTGDNIMMHSEYTAIVKNLDGWWIGWVEEVPGVNCQERTRPELMETLRETLREALEPLLVPKRHLENNEDPVAPSPR
jgi:predicted RNase H-like HicB family nuclease